MRPSSAREIILKAKYDIRYNEIRTVLARLSDEVIAFVKEENQKVTNALIDTLVEQKKEELNISQDVDINPRHRTRNGDSGRPNQDHSEIKVRKTNRKTRYLQTRAEKLKRIQDKVAKSDVEMYNQWREETIRSKIPAISVQKMLLMLEQCEIEFHKESMRKNVKKCVRQLADPCHTFWDHTQHTLRGLQSCLLTRNWDDMISLLVMLLRRKNCKIFIPIVKTMCEIMVEYNPQVKQLGLTDQFNELFSNVATNYKTVK